MDTETRAEPISFETHPSRYKHWKLAVDGAVARLTMAVDENAPLRPATASRNQARTVRTAVRSMNSSPTPPLIGMPSAVSAT